MKQKRSRKKRGGVRSKTWRTLRKPPGAIKEAEGARGGNPGKWHAVG